MKKDEKDKVEVKGLGFFGALTILFVALKLLGEISWSWWWVLSPLWLPTAVLFPIVLLAFVIKDVLSEKGKKNGQ